MSADGTAPDARQTGPSLPGPRAPEAITTAGARTVALAKLALAGEVAEVRAASRCHVCKRADWWRSTAARTVCRVCHPPAPGAEAPA